MAESLNQFLENQQDDAKMAVGYRASLFAGQEDIIAAIKQGAYEKIGGFKVGQQFVAPKFSEGLVIIDRAKIEANYIKGREYIVFAPKKDEGPLC